MRAEGGVSQTIGDWTDFKKAILSVERGREEGWLERDTEDGKEAKEGGC